MGTHPDEVPDRIVARHALQFLQFALDLRGEGGVTLRELVEALKQPDGSYDEIKLRDLALLFAAAVVQGAGEEERARLLVFCAGNALLGATAGRESRGVMMTIMIVGCVVVVLGT